MDFSGLHLTCAALDRQLRDPGRWQQVDSLDASENALAAVPETVAAMEELSHLDLSSNRICDASPLSSIRTLAYLYLYKNQLSEFDFVQSLSSLQYLSVHSNPLVRIPSELPMTLQYLNLAQCGLQQVPRVIETLVQLETLALNDNQMQGRADVSKLVRLKSLNLERNALEEVSGLGGLEELQVCNLSENSLKSLNSLPPNAMLLNTTSNPALGAAQQFKSSKRDQIEEFIRSNLPQTKK